MTQPALLQRATALAQATSEDEFNIAMASALDVIGASSYVAYILSSNRAGTEAHYVRNTMPAGLSAAIGRRQTHVMQHCRTSHLPIAWDRNTYAAAGQESLWRLGECFGVSQGAAVALHLDASRHFMIGVNWARTAPLTSDQSMAAVASIQMLAVFAEPAAQRLCNRLLSHHLDLNTDLSPRERECLFWVGRGMTDDIIGRILAISPRTVRKHVDACVSKLQASNRTEAAVTATRLGLTLDAPTRTFQA